jgi:hypothetical protein
MSAITNVSGMLQSTIVWQIVCCNVAMKNARRKARDAVSYERGLIMEPCVSAITLGPCSFAVAECHMASYSISAYALWNEATIPKLFGNP